MRMGMLGIATLVFGLAACNANSGEVLSASDKVPHVDRAVETRSPYPSTYMRYPGRPTVIRGATVFDGEGGQTDNGVVVFADGKVSAIGGAETQVPADAVLIDGTGKWVTPGIIDVHSHLGNYPSPIVPANNDRNEMTNPVNAQVWTEHSVWPQDPGFTRALTNGGVTTLQILPGSANVFGGRSVTLKNVPSQTVQAMKFPGAPYSLKMACGETPKHVYGRRNQAPLTRMGIMAIDRQTWLKAQQYRHKLQRHRDEGGAVRERDLQMDTLAGVLAGEILVQHHCYRSDEMANIIDMSKEFGYKLAAFHHAVEAYKIADLLRDNSICAATWADWYDDKMEANDAIGENVALVHDAGGCAVIHSDDINAVQRLNQEAAKALAAGRRMGIDLSDAVAWSWISSNAAKMIGVADQTGSLKPGKMADIVLWNGNPLSVYTRPEKVWIDGALLFDATDRARRPVSDFELGQSGEGDVK